MVTRRGFLEGLTATPLAMSACASAPDVAAPNGATDWQRIREHFTYPTDVGYFNTGTLGASPREVIEAFVGYVERLEETLPTYDYRNDEEPPLGGYGEFTGYRDDVAAFVNAGGHEEIALTLNATMGMNFTAHGLALERGDQVVMTNQEHPGGIGPWKLQAKTRGIEVVEVDILPHKDDPDALVKAFADAITPKTKVLMVSHLTSGRGILTPAKRLCALAKAQGLVAVLDGAQTVGQIRVDVQDLGCDVYINSPHKWLGAPKGSGFLWASSAMNERIVATLASAQFDNLEWGIGRLGQYGTYNVGQLHGLRAAIAFQNAVGGPARIEARVRELTERLRAGLDAVGGVTYLSSTHPDMIAGVTVFALDGVGAHELEDELWRRKIRVRSIGKEGVRVGTHYYTLESEVDRLLETVQDLRKQGA